MNTSGHSTPPTDEHDGDPLDMVDVEMEMGRLEQQEKPPPLPATRLRPTGRGILMEEVETIPGQFASTLHAFGRTRQLQLAAFYDADNRQALNATLHRTFESLTIHDWDDSK